MEMITKNQKGFTLMVAMLVSTIVIVVGLGVSSIILRQFNLAVLSRESQSAFYAADTLVECILYYDLEAGLFDDAFSLTTPMNLTTLQDLVCDQKVGPPAEDITMDIEQVGPDEVIDPCPATIDDGVSRTRKNFTTTLLLESSKGAYTPIAYASITKSQSCEVGDLYTILTQIDSNGYNSNRPGDDRKIERGLRLTY